MDKHLSSDSISIPAATNVMDKHLSSDSISIPAATNVMDKRRVKKKKKGRYNWDDWDKLLRLADLKRRQRLFWFNKKLSVQSLRRIGIIRHNYLGEHDDFRIHVVNVDLSSMNVDLSSRDRRYGCRGCDGCVNFEASDECAVRLLKPAPIDDFIDVDPALHLRLVPRPTRSKLCVVNSTVYVFDGYTGNRFDESDPKFNAKWISSYVLKEEVLGGAKNKEVGESDLIKTCEMIYPKYNPRAVPTPNGKKILIFSGVLSPELDGCFEFYDIDSNTCELLPRMEPIYSGYEAHIPAAYGFLSDTRFFLETNSGRFIYHLEDPSERPWWGWQPLGFPAIPWEMRIKGYREGFRKGLRKGFEVIEGGYVLKSDSVHYLPEVFRSMRGVEEKCEEGPVPKNKRSTFPLSFKPVGLRLVDEDMMLVDYNREDQVCHVCTLRAYPLDDDKTQVFVDLIRVYLPTSDRPTLDSTLVQSLRVEIKGLVGNDALHDVGLSLCCL